MRNVFSFCYHIHVIETGTKSSRCLISMVRGQRSLLTEEVIVLKWHKDCQTGRGRQRNQDFIDCDRKRNTDLKNDTSTEEENLKEKWIKAAAFRRTNNQQETGRGNVFPVVCGTLV